MSYSYSAEGGTRTRIRPFECEYEYHFIEYEKAANSATSKLTLRVVIDGESATLKLPSGGRLKTRRIPRPARVVTVRRYTHRRAVQAMLENSGQQGLR